MVYKLCTIFVSTFEYRVFISFSMSICYNERRLLQASPIYFKLEDILQGYRFSIDLQVNTKFLINMICNF